MSMLEIDFEVTSADELPQLPPTIGRRHLFMDPPMVFDGRIRFDCRPRLYLTADEDLAVDAIHLTALFSTELREVLAMYPPTWWTTSTEPDSWRYLWAVDTAITAVQGFGAAAPFLGDVVTHLTTHREIARRDWAGTLSDFLRPQSASVDGIEFEFAAAAAAASERTGWKVGRSELLEAAERIGWIRRHWGPRGFTPTSLGIAEDAVFRRFKTIRDQDGKRQVEYCLLTGSGFERLFEYFISGSGA